MRVFKKIHGADQGVYYKVMQYQEKKTKKRKCR